MVFVSAVGRERHVTRMHHEQVVNEEMGGSLSYATIGTTYVQSGLETIQER